MSSAAGLALATRGAGADSCSASSRSAQRLRRRVASSASTGGDAPSALQLLHDLGLEPCSVTTAFTCAVVQDVGAARRGRFGIDRNIGRAGLEDAEDRRDAVDRLVQPHADAVAGPHAELPPADRAGDPTVRPSSRVVEARAAGHAARRSCPGDAATDSSSRSISDRRAASCLRRQLGAGPGARCSRARPGCRRRDRWPRIRP